MASRHQPAPPSALAATAQALLLGGMIVPTAEPDVDIDEAVPVDVQKYVVEEVKRRKAKKGRKSARAYHGQLPFELSSLLGEANISYVMREYQQAVDKCKKVIQALPSHPAAYSLLGLIYEDQGDAKRAIDAYRLAVHADPSDGETWKKLGGMCKQERDIPGAMTAFSKAASLNKDDLEVTLDAAMTCAEGGDSRRAVRWYRQALEHPNLAAPPTILLRVAELLHGLKDRQGVIDALADCTNWCMGADAETIAAFAAQKNEASSGSSNAAGASSSSLSGAAAVGAPDVDDDDEDGDEDLEGDEDIDEDEDAADATPAAGASSSDSAAAAPSTSANKSHSANPTGRKQPSSASTAAAAPSRFRTPSLLVPRHEWVDAALNAINMLCELYLEDKRYGAVARLVERAHVYVDNAGKGPLPLDLTIKYGIAKVWLGDDATATRCFGQLLSNPVEEYGDMYLDVGAALAHTGKAQAALGILGKLRLSATSASASAKPVNLQVDGDDEEEPGGGPLVECVAEPAMRTTFLLAESACYNGLGQPRRAAARLYAAAMLQPSRTDLIERAAASMAAAGAHLKAAQLLAHPDVVRAQPTEEAATDVLYRAALHARTGGRKAEYCMLMQKALGCGTPAEYMTVRVRRVAVVQAKVGQEKFYQLVEEICRYWGSVGEPGKGVRFVDLVVQAEAKVKQLLQQANQQQKASGGAGGAADGTAASTIINDAAKAGQASSSSSLRQSRKEVAEAAGGRRSARATKRPTKLAENADDGADDDDDSDGDDDDAGPSKRSKRKRKADDDDDGDEDYQEDEDGDAAADDEDEEADGDAGLDEGDLDIAGLVARTGLLGADKKRRRRAPNKRVKFADEVGGAGAGSSALPGGRNGGSKLQMHPGRPISGELGIGNPFVTRLQELASRLMSGSTVSESLLNGVRRVAARYPYHIGIWTLCRLLDSRAGDGASSHTKAFRKAVVRYASTALDSLPLLMLIGSECLLGRTYRLAVGVYLEAFRLAPRDPLVSLCLSVAYLAQVMSRVTVNKNLAALRGFAFLVNYKRLRLEQGVSMAESAESMVTAGIAGGAAAASSLEVVDGADEAPTTVPAAAPPSLPRSLLEAESEYNCARACHQLSLPHLASHCYEAALRAWDTAQSAADDMSAAAPSSTSSSSTPFSRELLTTLDVRREAAYNYCLLLKASGAEAKALRITRKYLAYD